MFKGIQFRPLRTRASNRNATACTVGSPKNTFAVNPSRQIANMPPKGASTKVTPMRLPPLHKLRIRRPNQADANPCLSIMTSVLTCWASAGYNVAGCAAIESQLRACMDAPRPKSQKKNTINYHLSRMYPNIVGPRKRK